MSRSSSRPAGQPVRLVVNGCCGRMGTLIVEEAGRDKRAFRLVGGVEDAAHPQSGKPHPANPSLKVSGDLGAVLKAGADLVIEFTTPEATMDHVRVIREMKKPMVIGTTGLGAEQLQAIQEAARHTPILLSPNMSVGVNLLFELVRLAAERLPDYKVTIEETHHAGKKDAPSGTAKRLQDVIGKIKQETIPCESKRIGDVVGEHAVTLTGKFEKVTLSHEAFNRDVFALGALRAAQFLARVKKPGLYDMSDVLKDSKS